MATTVVVRGSGGTLFEMDVPAGGTLLDTWNEKIASGELVIVTAPVKWVDGIDGAKHLVLDVTAEPEPEPPAEDAESEAEPAEPAEDAESEAEPAEPAEDAESEAEPAEDVESEVAAEPKRRGRPPKSTEETTEVAPPEE